MSYVYFVYNESRGAIKIGRTILPKNRLSVLQTANVDELKQLGLIEGAEDLESKLHEQFKHLKIRGEWYKADAELIEFIQNNANAVVQKKPRKVHAKSLPWQGKRIVLKIN